MARVLIVDDDENLRFCYQKFISDLRHEVVTAENIAQARSILEESEFDVALVDCVFPEGDNAGIELLKYIYEQKPLCQAILVSGYPSFNRAITGLRYKAFSCLVKPVAKKKLCQVVESAVKKNSLEKEKILKETVPKKLRIPLTTCS
ncbi:MAG: response regulator [Desulfobacterales bacterium]|nr:response regulator [Desulfobacterales bacterium]